MSEIALISSRKSRLETAAKKGSKSAKTALDLANSPNKFLSAVQIGITLIGILTGIYSGDKITKDVEVFVSSYEAIKPFAHSFSVGIVVMILTFFSLVLGELLPKRIGLNHPESIAKAMAMPMKVISIITAPFIWLLTTSTEFLLKILQIKPTADGKVTEEEIKAIIKEGTEVGEVQEIEQDIVERVFHIGDRKVNALMTHRSSMVYLSMDDTLEEIKSKVLDELHSVYPVCEENLDEVVGVVFLKDLFANFEKGNFDLRSIAREPSYFIEHTSAYKALENFKKTKIQAETELQNQKIRIKEQKLLRDERRIHIEATLNEEELFEFNNQLAEESKKESILLKKMTKYWKLTLQTLEEKGLVFSNELMQLKEERKAKSAALQQKLFAEYSFFNQYKEKKSLGEI